jgi:hypothetical protein
MSSTGRVRTFRERDAAPREHLTVVCQCGLTISGLVEHYQLARCRCGATYWALQPRRAKPMELRRWPGTAEMLREEKKQDGQVAPNYVERRAAWLKGIRE